LSLANLFAVFSVSVAIARSACPISNRFFLNGLRDGTPVSTSVLNKSNKSNLAFGFDLNLIREVEI
jgi:hypothetical protein